MPHHDVQHSIKAVRLFNTADGECSFQTGFIPTNAPIPTSYFFGQTQVDDYQKRPHPAPRKQYVVTLRGRLRFSVSNGDTFIIEPGILLLAEDTTGPGHSWTLIDGDRWERLYIPFPESAETNFVTDAQSA
jgi:hypothetical protein